MKPNSFNVKTFWREMKELFPEIDIKTISEDTNQWSTFTSWIIERKFHH